MHEDVVFIPEQKGGQMERPGQGAAIRQSKIGQHQAPTFTLLSMSPLSLLCCRVKFRPNGQSTLENGRTNGWLAVALQPAAVPHRVRWYGPNRRTMHNRWNNQQSTAELLE